MSNIIDNREGFIASLVKIQSELKVPKKQKNQYGNYNFRNCDDIIEAVKPLLLKENLVLIMTDSIECYNNNIYVKATAKLLDNVGDCIEVSAYAREVPEKSGILTEPMLTGSASSYARKYALNGLFALDDSKDPDDNIEPQKEAPKPSASKPSPKQLDIIRKNLTEEQLHFALGLKGFQTIEELDKDSASEIVKDIISGMYN